MKSEMSSREPGSERSRVSPPLPSRSSSVSAVIDKLLEQEPPSFDRIDFGTDYDDSDWKVHDSCRIYEPEGHNWIVGEFLGWTEGELALVRITDAASSARDEVIAVDPGQIEPLE